MTDEIVAKESSVALVRRKKKHFDLFQKWYANDGEWQKFDAPWEEMPKLDTARAWVNYLKNLGKEKSGKYRQLLIKHDGDYAGWLSIYDDGAHPEAKMIGIDICEDAKLNRGIGTRALKLGIQYIFRTYQCPSIGLVTWSFNPRMIHVAKKVGFSEVPREKKARLWNGQWIDRHVFMLKRR